MKLFLIIFSSLLGFSAMAQQNAMLEDPSVKSRTINGSFNAIQVSDGISLYLSAGKEESVAISTSDSKYEDRFKTEVKDGVLKIYYDHKGIGWTGKDRRNLRAYVSFKTLEKLDASGGASVKIPVGITLGNFVMKFSSGSSFDGQVTATEIDIDQSSGSHIDLSGKADKVSVEASSGAKFMGFGFSANSGSARASSGAKISFTIEKELSARVSSGAQIRYKGAAMLKDIDVSSGGTVKKA